MPAAMPNNVGSTTDQPITPSVATLCQKSRSRSARDRSIRRWRLWIRLVSSSPRRDRLDLFAALGILLRFDQPPHQVSLQLGLEGASLALPFAQRPELIGGMRVQVGCDVYDGSVRAWLEALEKSF